MIAVRLAKFDDAESIARQTSSVQQLHTEALPDIFKPPSPDLFPPKKTLSASSRPNCVVAVAEMNGMIVGHIYGAVVNRKENEFNPAQAHMYIQQIGVDDAARRQGVGTALIGFIRDRARSLGLTDIRVEHWAFNARAGSFFETCGFSPMKVMMRRAVKDDAAP